MRYGNPGEGSLAEEEWDPGKEVRPRRSAMKRISR